jgi:hypothetical protein
MVQVKIVGFYSETGPGSGKSYLAKQLEQYPKDSNLPTCRKWLSFAMPLKIMAAQIYQLITGRSNPEKHEPMLSGHTYRELLVLLGTDLIRTVEPNFWVKCLDCWVEDYKNYPTDEIVLVVIDDVRFLNEAEYIINNGGKVYNICVPDKVNEGDITDIPPELVSGLMTTLFIPHNDEISLEVALHKIISDLNEEVA